VPSDPHAAVGRGDIRQVRLACLASLFALLLCAWVVTPFAAPAPAAEQTKRSSQVKKADERHGKHRRRRARRRKGLRAPPPAAQKPKPTMTPPLAAPADLPDGEGEVESEQSIDPQPQDSPNGPDAVDGSRRLMWADEFSGAEGAAPDPANWNADVGGNGWGNDELQYYTARRSNASLDGKGNLVIIARAEAYRGADGVERSYTSARLQTLEKVEFTYGLLEARIQVPEGRGLAPAFWTLGNEAYEGDEGRWPECGEMDVMEIIGSDSSVLNGTLHGPWPTAPHGIGSELELPTPLTAGFHTYGVEWEPERVSFLLDGSTYATVSSADLAPGDPWPFQHPNFLLLNLAVGGDWPGSPDASTGFPARMLVDWVHIYR
jgi:beta-glucanase (GH16 family)